MRKPVFGVPNQVQHKSGCTATKDVYTLKISDLEMIYVAKTKALISVQLICTFVLEYAKSRFSHDVAQF